MRCGSAWIAVTGAVLSGILISHAAAVDEISPAGRSFETLPPLAARGDWPWWRGAQMNGIAEEPSAPTSWSPTENVVWRADVPGRGQSSPIVSGSRVFLASADEQAEVQWLLAYDRASGKRLWQTELHRGGFMRDIHRKSTHAAATAACDGQRVFIPLIHAKSLWVSATDLAGKILWQTDAGAYDAEYGFGSSPVLYGSLVIVCGDNDRPGSFLAALHRKTGQIVWRVRRPNIDTYATPIVGHVAGRDQLLLGGSGFLWSYEPSSGQLVWQCAGPTKETTANTAAFSRDQVFASGGYPKPYTLMAVRGDGRGDVTASHLQWTLPQHMSYVPSPLYHDGFVYVVSDGGIASCLDAATGKSRWTKRLSGDFSASPVLCGGRLYAANEDGVTFVLRRSKV